jgi:tetratricopeptide (TPR) repeat protein
MTDATAQPADLQLDTLEARGLIRIATVEPELEYLFRHALLQDTAYESLLKQERRALHQVVGHALETLYPDRIGELAAVLALHYEQAGETEKAMEYLVMAANFASERNAIVEAVDLFTRARALLPAEPDPSDPVALRRRIEIDLGRVRSGFSFMTEGQAIGILEPLIEPAKALGDLRLEAEVHIHIALTRQFRGERPNTHEQLRTSLERVGEIARELDDPTIAALPESIVGLFQIFTGQIREGIAKLEASAPLLERKHDFIGSAFGLVALAMGYARLGEFDKATDAAKRATALGERGDLISKLDALIGESTVQSIRGNLAEAVPIAQRCTNLAEETGATACVVASNFVLGDAYMRQGKFGDAKIAFERGSEVANAVEQRVFSPSITAYLRANAASMGDFGPKARTFDQALAETRAINDRWGEANVIWKRANTEARMTPGNAEQMLADYSAAASAFEEMGARPFLARVSRDWAEALFAMGRRDEATEQLQRAATLLRELGIDAEADDAEARLAA